MPRILEVARRVLDEEGIRHEPIGGATALRFGYRTPFHQWAVVVESREAEDLFLCVAVVPDVVPEDRLAAMAELLARVNITLVLGNFDLDYDAGQVRFRTSIDLEGSDATPALIRQLVRANLATVARNISAIKSVIAGASPHTSLAR